MSRDDVLVDAAAGGGTGDVGVGPAELVAAELVDLLVLGQGVLVTGCCVLVMRASSPGRSWGRCWCWWARCAGAARSPGTGRAGVDLFPGRSGSGDVCGADPVAVGDGGQPLHVGADQPADHRGLGLAQLRELRRHVRHRAVVLAELPAAGDRRGRGSVALGGERDGEGLGPVDGRTGAAADGLLDRAGCARLEPGELLLGDGPDGVGAAGARRRSAARSGPGRRRRAGRRSGRRR